MEEARRYLDSGVLPEGFFGDVSVRDDESTSDTVDDNNSNSAFMENCPLMEDEQQDSPELHDDAFNEDESVDVGYGFTEFERSLSCIQQDNGWSTVLEQVEAETNQKLKVRISCLSSL